MGKTLFDKIWDAHIVRQLDAERSLIYIDRHLVHEVTSPQAFDGLRLAGRPLRRVDATYAVLDHNVPTYSRSLPVQDPECIQQIEALERNCKEFNVFLIDMHDQRQGIIHVMAPEQGMTLPGTTIVCGDSHTATHGAFGALAFGIGTSEIEHVMATQTLIQQRPKTMQIVVDDELPFGTTAKDLILSIIQRIGIGGATGYVIEYTGKAFRTLSMEGRMTVCNMSIEAGARAGLVAPDTVTYDYLKGRPFAPTFEQWDSAVAHWETLHSDADAVFDTVVRLRGDDIEPVVTWGTNPGQSVSVNASIPDPQQFADPSVQAAAERALAYQGLLAGLPIRDITIDRVFIGSCTNARIEDLRAAAAVVKGHTVSSHVKAMVVPGSGLVKHQAEQEGLADIFKAAGFDWREAGCSMCLGMNEDRLSPQERCASTSNRNFEGRQGKNSRTHLVSPSMAAAAAIAGHFVDVREWK